MGRKRQTPLFEAEKGAKNRSHLDLCLGGVDPVLLGSSGIGLYLHPGLSIVCAGAKRPEHLQGEAAV